MHFFALMLCLACSAVGQTVSTPLTVASAAPQVQIPSASPTKPAGPADVAQTALDQHLYFALKLTMDVTGSQLRPEQHDFFTGMLAFHEGRFELARQRLSASLNAHDSILTSEQKILALEALGRDARLTGDFAGCAQMFEDVDKIWGTRLGDAELDIKQNRHFCVAQMGRPKQTVEFTTLFTIHKAQGMYPVHVGTISEMAQLDTGADETVIIESTAKKWGVVPSEATVVLHGYSGGEFKGHPAVIASMSLGTATLHNVPVLIVSDAELFIAPIHLQTRVLLGLPVLMALGRLTFSADGSLTATPQTPDQASDIGASIWLGDSQLLVQAGTLSGTRGVHFGGTHEPRLFVLDTGSGSSYLTDHYLSEHPEQFQGAPPEMAKLVGAGGEVDSAAYSARHLPIWFGSSEVEMNGQHVLATPISSPTEYYEGLLGQDLLSTVKSYTIDFRLMRFSVQP